MARGRFTSFRQHSPTLEFKKSRRGPLHNAFLYHSAMSPTPTAAGKKKGMTGRNLKGRGHPVSTSHPSSDHCWRSGYCSSSRGALLSGTVSGPPYTVLYCMYVDQRQEHDWKNIRHQSIKRSGSEPCSVLYRILYVLRRRKAA